MFHIIKTKITLIIFLFSIAFILPSCASIFGGGSYYAHINVKNNDHAKISYHGKVRGTGSAIIKVKRIETNMLEFRVEDDDCPEEVFHFTERTFRGWALAGSILTGNLTIGSFPIPIPIGLMIDLGNNTFWKPNVNEKNVSKTNFRHFNYTLNYNKCSTKEIQEVKVIDGPYLEH